MGNGAYVERAGSKHRACLVLERTDREIHVLKITNQDKSHRHDYVRISTRNWDPSAAKDSWLQLWPVITLDGRTGSIDRFAGVCDPVTWHLVSQRRTQPTYRTPARAWFDRLAGSWPAWGIAAAVATLLCCPVGAIVIAAANALIVAVFVAVLLTTHHGATWRHSY